MQEITSLSLIGGFFFQSEKARVLHWYTATAMENAENNDGKKNSAKSIQGNEWLYSIELYI